MANVRDWFSVPPYSSTGIRTYTQRHFNEAMRTLATINYQSSRNEDTDVTVLVQTIISARDSISDYADDATDALTRAEREINGLVNYIDGLQDVIRVMEDYLPFVHYVMTAGEGAEIESWISKESVGLASLVWINTERAVVLLHDERDIIMFRLRWGKQ